jgi:K+-transporting ATPase ATPase A chain
MSPVLAGVLFIVVLVLALALAYKPLGDHMYRVVSSTRHLLPERAFTSAANNNGSAFAGLTVSGTWYNTALGLAMLIGRFLPMVFVLGLAGSLAKQKPVPESTGTLKTYQPLFVGMLVGVTVILVALTFLPALALGPLAEGVH